MTEQEFSQRLTRLRVNKGVSARDMSLSIGQNPGYIHNIESGKAMPSLAGFFYICDYLGIQPGDFFDVQSQDPQRLLALNHKLKGLNDHQLQIIEALVEELRSR